MNDLLTYNNIDWEKYLYLFNLYPNVQCLFLIPSDESDNSLFLGEFNNLKIYDITFSKIKFLKNIGPFITIKKYTKNFTNNIEDGIVDFYKENRFFKWIGILDENYKYDIFPNIFFKFNLEEIPSVAYLIPFRNRHETLKDTIIGITQYIKYQNINADIWVIQQNENGDWNKGVTSNCGFLALKKFYDYFIFNDADTFSDLTNKFIYPKENEVNHLYGYDHCLGGIFSCHKKTFIKINGYNNNFFNWGREDRDLIDRCKENDIVINRDHLLKLNSCNVIHLNHDNKLNYWNCDKKTSQFNLSRNLYYLNQIEHNKKNFESGLKSLIYTDSSNIDNNKTIILINLKSWTDSKISIMSNNKIAFDIIIEPKLDTGLLKINYENKSKDLPINPYEKFPKLKIEINKDINFYQVNIRYNYLFDYNFKITNEDISNKFNLIYDNIELEFDSILNPFSDNSIKYHYNVKYCREYYLNNVFF